MSFSSHRHRHKRYSEAEAASTTRSSSIDFSSNNGTTTVATPASATVDAALSASIASYYGSSSLNSSSFAYSDPTVLPSYLRASISAGTGLGATGASSAELYTTGSIDASTRLAQTASDGSLYSAVATTLATSRTVDRPDLGATTTSQFLSIASPTSLASPSATADVSTSTGVLTNTNKAIIGGVLGGLGGLGLVCALVFVVLNKGNKRKRPESRETLHTPQRMRDSQSTMQSPLQPKPSSRFMASLTLSTSRPHTCSTQRSRKYSEPPSPILTGGFQVISGRRLSSPPDFHGVPGEATRTFGSTNSSPRSALTTPSRRSRLGSTPTVYRDAIGRSQDIGSTVSHTSRFIERIDDT